MATFNLCLIPEENFAKELIKVSEEINKQIGSLYLVGKNSLPHLTVLQFEVENPKFSRQFLTELLGREIIVKTKELYENFSDGGNTWFGVEAEKTDDLVKLQEEVLSIMQTQEIHNKTGDNYFPHFTTGMKPGKHTAKLLKSNLTNKKVKCTVELGYSKEHFTVPELV